MTKLIVNERIRKLREERGISQTNIAKALHTSQTVYSRYELGKRELPISQLVTLCKLYDVSADYILGFTNEPLHLPKYKKE